MDFGKLETIEDVDWHLPADTPLTAAFLAGELGEILPSTKSPTNPNVFIGSTAWGQKSFVGSIYPKVTKPAGFLKAYADQFNTIELNTTFYRIPSIDQVVRWAEQTPEDFKFCPKVSSMITQSKGLGEGTGRIEEFTNAVKFFGQRLGPCFAQLPSTFKTNSFETLLGFLDRWPASVKLCLELRHSSWFCESEGNDLFAELAARGIGTVITDVAGRRDVAHMNVTAAYQQIRWVGNVDSSDDVRLADWAARAASWLNQGLKELYLFIHQPEELPSAESSIKIGKMLRETIQQPFTIRTPEKFSSDASTIGQIELF